MPAGEQLHTPVQHDVQEIGGFAFPDQLDMRRYALRIGGGHQRVENFLVDVLEQFEFPNDFAICLPQYTAPLLVPRTALQVGLM